MHEFVFMTVCNEPRLRDPTKAQEVIDRYWFDWDFWVSVVPAQGCFRLNMQGEGWPGAWHIPAHVPLEEFAPNFNRDGLLDFEVLLLEIAPLLLEPLIVQSAGSVKGLFPLNACEWRVLPGAHTIERTRFSEAAIHSSPAAQALVAV